MKHRHVAGFSKTETTRPGQHFGFTLVELLVVITVIALLMALLVPGVMAVRSAADNTRCINRISQIGKAHITARTARVYVDSRNWTATLLPYLENNETLLVCPVQEVDQTSYGMNNCAEFMREPDANKILLLDYRVTDVGFVTQPPEERCESWLEDQDFRHGGSANVLYWDGRVETHIESEIDPCSDDPCCDTKDDMLGSIYKKLWVPKYGCGYNDDPSAGSGDSSDQDWIDTFDGVDDPNHFSPEPGLTAEYRPTAQGGAPEWGAAAGVSRTDLDLNMPFGSGFAGGPPGPDHGQNPFPDPRRPFSVIWRGQIRADVTGPHIFFASHDDGFWLTIDGQQIYANPRWNGGPFNWGPSQPIEMQAGEWVDFEARLHQQYRGGNHVRLQWTAPGLTRQDIPSSNFRTGPPGQ